MCVCVFVCRFLLKKWPSSRELTEYDIAKEKREKDISEGRISSAKLYGIDTSEAEKEEQRKAESKAKISDLRAKYSVIGEINRQGSATQIEKEATVEEDEGNLPIFAPLR